MMLTARAGLAGIAACLLLGSAVGFSQPTATEQERELDSLVEGLEQKIDSWERRPAEREELEDDIEQDIDRLGGYYQNRYGSLLALPGYGWRGRRTLDRTNRLLNRAGGFGHGGFNRSLAGAWIAFGGVLGQPGVTNLGRPRAAVAAYGRAGSLLSGDSDLWVGLNNRLGGFNSYTWFRPNLYGPHRPQEKEESKRAPLPDRTLGEIVDEYLLNGKREQIAEAVGNMPVPEVSPTAEDLLQRYGFLEDKAGRVWAQISELQYRLAAEGHHLQPDTVAWTANLQVALEEAAAGLDHRDLDQAHKGVKRGEFEIARLARLVGR